MEFSNNADEDRAIADNLEALWMPFTHNRLFKKKPRLIEKASGMYYETSDGRKVLDGISGLWCSNVGHNHPKISEAVKSQLDVLDFSPPFQVGHGLGFELANELIKVAPESINHVFFTNSGSEACDTAMKIALAYYRVLGEDRRYRFIGREKGYHGVGFGGISVGGIDANRNYYKKALLPDTKHICHTHNLSEMAFSKDQPRWGAHLADDLEELLKGNTASEVAGVIVEPMQGSAGVIVPPDGYLEKIRAICDRHNVLLIFDEVITGFGRLGEWFSPDRFGVVPDMITFAKGVTNGVIPLGGVLVNDQVFQSIMVGPEHLVEFFHGYTYSGHPLACAAGIAAMEVYRDEDLLSKARRLEQELEHHIHTLQGEPHVVDIRNLGMACAVEFSSKPDQPPVRAMEIFQKCFERGLMIRYTGDIIAIGPALVASTKEIEFIIETIREVVRDLA